jgi:hypothetical protein
MARGVVMVETWAVWPTARPCWPPGRLARGAVRATAVVLLAVVLVPWTGASRFSARALVPGNPIGRFDGFSVGPGDGSTTDSSVDVFGWAIDPDTSAPVYVDVYVDGHFAMRVPADQPRPDVAKAYPDYGPSHGFDTTIAVNGLGAHQVCAYGINVAGGNANPSLGCRQVTVQGNPMGRFESLTLVGSGTRMSAVGWALDPNTAAPIDVDVYVDGTFNQRVLANLDRPDVAAALPGYGPDHGFDATIDLTLGKHVVEVFAINVGAGTTNPHLDVGRAVFLTGEPFGNLDQASVSISDLSLVTLSGWAIDPDTTAPIRVDVWFTPAVGARRSISLTADQSRPDVAGAYPLAGPDHGYSGTVRLPSGRWTICAYGINVASGTGNPRLGRCRVAIIP